MSPLNSSILLLAATILGGCGNVDPNHAFFQVANTVQGRTGKRVQWNRGTVEDAATTRAVAEILRRPLTADAAVQVALLNNRELQATLENLGVAQADLVQAGLLRNPVFTFERRFPGRAMEMDLVKEFIDIVLLPIRQRVAADQFQATKLQISHDIVEFGMDARIAFYRAQGDEQMCELWRTIAQATERAAEAALKLNEAGNTSDLDLATQQALHLQAKLNYAQAQETAQQSREQLNQKLGVWGTQTSWKLSPRLPEVLGEEDSAAGLESRAIAQRLDLAAARYELFAQAKRLRYARFEAIAEPLQITAHYEREMEGDQSIGPSVNVPIPIFDQGQAVVGRSRAQLFKAEQRYLSLAVSIRTEVRAARDRMRLARSRVRYYRSTAIPIYRRVVAETQLQYNAMQVGVIPLLQAKQEEINSGRGYVEALRDYWVARTDLEKALGGSFRSQFIGLQTIESTKRP